MTETAQAVMPFPEALRRADAMGIPYWRGPGAYIEDSRKWGGEKPPCGPWEAAGLAARTYELHPIGSTPRYYVIGQVPGFDCEDWWPWEYARCPACGGSYADCYPQLEPDPDWGMPAYYLVIHLHDEHRWTRTRIADWLESDPSEADGACLEGP